VLTQLKAQRAFPGFHVVTEVRLGKVGFVAGSVPEMRRFGDYRVYAA
jgi:hypothetical protein